MKPPAANERLRQLPLDLGRRAGLSRDDLVVSTANANAVSLIERWPDWTTPVFVLAGPPGSGKSHLASIWTDRAGARRLPAERLLAAPLGRPPIQALIEDADIPGLDQQGLFHLINAVRGGDGHLLLTARRFPAAWGVTLPDLASRLKAVTLVEIGEPDDLLLAGVMTKLFADRQVEVEPNVVQYLMRRIERSLSAASDIVDRLDRVALERQVRISRNLAAEMLHDAEYGDFDEK